MAATNNNNLTTSVPVFTGSGFWVWEQKMGDYLKSQCLWCITTGAPGSMQPEALLQAAWDENSEQVQGIIGSHISQMLHPHIGMTCAKTWTNLQTRFGTPGVFEITVDMYAAYSMKLSSTHNPPDMERINILSECLTANSMDFNNSVQGIILLNAIPKEWSMVAQIYSQSNQTLATTTFLGVRDAIMANFECSMHPLTLAMHKISAVKCKGKSPTYSEQTKLSQLLLKLPMMHHQVLPKRRPEEVGKVKQRCTLL